jgi:sugar lactone lactonase YvrE
VLWFSDVVGNVVRQWSPDGTVKELLRPGGYDGSKSSSRRVHRSQRE